jgi:hypothetical protein
VNPDVEIEMPSRLPRLGPRTRAVRKHNQLIVMPTFALPDLAALPSRTENCHRCIGRRSFSDALSRIFTLLSMPAAVRFSAVTPGAGSQTRSESAKEVSGRSHDELGRPPSPMSVVTAASMRRWASDHRQRGFRTAV